MDLPLTRLVDWPALATWYRVFLAGPDDPPHVRTGRRGLTLLMAGASLGGLALLTALVKGHHVMGTTSEVPWGVLIATYVFLVVSSTGLCLVSSLGHVFGFRLFMPLATRALFLALVTLLVGFSVIASELERPFLLLSMVFLSPNPASPIWWMGTLYSIYMILIATELYLLMTHQHARARTVGILGVTAAVAAHSNLGAVFGLSHSRPFWYGPLLPVYFIASALMCGAALLVLVTYLEERYRQPSGEVGATPLLDGLRRLLALFVGVAAFMTVWKLITAVNGGHGTKAEVAAAALTGPLFVSFWLFEAFLGVALPAYVLLSARARQPAWLAGAAGSVMAGVFIMRLNFVYQGQMLSLKPVVGHLGERLSYAPPFKGNVAGFLPYTPSLVEALIVVGSVCAVVLLYVGGTRVLRLQPDAEVR